MRLNWSQMRPLPRKADMSQTKVELLEAKSDLVKYILSKIKSGDWHAVQDGASDIREIDAKLEMLNELAAPRLSDSAAAAVSATVGPERGKDSGTSLYDARTDRYRFADGSVDQSKNELLVGPR